MPELTAQETSSLYGYFHLDSGTCKGAQKTGQSTKNKSHKTHTE